MLLLCNAGDATAAWLYGQLAPRVAGLEIVTAEALAYALRWEHRVGSGGASTRITLGDGRVIDSGEVRGVVQRIWSFPTDHLRARAEDREYAASEMHALLISCLHTLGAAWPGMRPRPLAPAPPASSGGAVVLAGIATERPLAMVARELEGLGADLVWLDQRQVDAIAMDETALRIGGRDLALTDVAAVYTRLMDDRQLPALRAEPPGSPRAVRCRRLHDDFTRWCEETPARVVNRASAMASNGSKPYQLQLIREHGFLVPETLVTNDVEACQEFARQHGRVVYKSISGVRSIVQLLDQASMTRIDAIRWCPTQFQQFIDGINVRVHVVGSELYATAAHTAAVDYRYGDTELTAYELDDVTAARCRSLAASLGLEFAGIDLKLAPNGDVYCFEVNPSPGFSYFEAATGQPIARAVARLLIGAA
ncbi:MAG TPA: hypothetical protein VFS60_10260 [Thermoanaerobaculia bacterium]|nr:hypothetical protein [Thermoanaerobaculia bacterium]